ncbi:TIGR02221 family CRISPR-associated protein [Meiothermus sp. QL-1]|uniref:TIGR02221 family CRISPR-associated protein n=1 Tax=Meiothermus sp. QL-1 TaxID=2058095 RepID=UPI000E0B1A19|nr:TIGR02221 family CRISPR-associated protein [Meiothermus sp. QL-1]RDI95589.1 TIGR02221 family CRISPR-associated protein [Meiothermus sp. QL-1]
MIILSMLGTGNYQEVEYIWDGCKARPHRFFQSSLKEWFPEAQLLICVTEEAKNKHGEDILQELTGAKLIDIPSGQNEAEYWQIFNIIQEEIPEGTELVLDITHGFRSLPILALLAVSFLRIAKGVVLKYVLYGAYEAKTDSSAPVFDLTPFVSMLDWATASQYFLETGDAGKFQPLVEARGEKPVNTHLNTAVKGLGSLSSALAANRALEIGEVARETLGSLGEAQKEAWKPQHQPLKLLLPRLKDMLGHLALKKSPSQEDYSQEDYLRQNFALVLWLLQNQQFEKALGLAREWMVSFAQYRRQGSWYPISFDSRKEAEGWLNSCVKGETETPEEWKDFIQLWRDLGNLRNDLMHFGFRESPRGKESIPQEFREKIDKLRDVIRGMNFECPEGMGSPRA